MARSALIVGAGIGGLSTAIALRKAGWDVRIFERSNALRELGFGVGLAPNAMAALAELGVADDVLARSFQPASGELRRMDGTVLKRAATKGDGWLTYYYTAESFKKSWAKIRAFAAEAGRNPDELTSTNQLPICIGPRAKIEAPMKHWLQTEWDYASWSESTMESAIMGTPDECVEQLMPHIEAGIDRIIFVPYKYEKEQVEAVAQEIIPRLKKRAAGAKT